MTTLITFFHGTRSLGSCTAACYNAKKPDCGCICGGINHGVGFHQADRHAKGLLYLIMNKRNYVPDRPGVTSVHYGGHCYDVVQRTLRHLEQT